MKMHLLFFILPAFTAFAQPSPPSAQMMMEWIAFTKLRDYDLLLE
jgi:hypothetical protein